MSGSKEEGQLSIRLTTLNRLSNIHKLTILKALRNSKTSFKELKALCMITDGNLASHMRQLEMLRFIVVIKEFDNNKVKTSYEITNEGREIYDELVLILIDLISQQSVLESMPARG